MRTVGIVASVLGAVVVAGFLLVLLRSAPDLARYRRLRKM